MAEFLSVKDVGHVRTIVLNRAEKKNALNQKLAWEIIQALDTAAGDDNIWVVAITGRGDAFCSGLDLSGSEPFTPLSPMQAQLDDVNWVGNLFLAMRKRCDKPVVGGINGVAVGAGLGLAMACDVRLLSRSARLMAGYTRIGGSPDAGLTITLPQMLGYERAMRFMIENRTLYADEAYAWGMAGEVVDDDRFDDRLAAYCEELCGWSPISLRLLKRGLARAVEMVDVESQLRYEVSNIVRAFGSEDGKEARQAFLEKRDPVFRGR